MLNTINLRFGLKTFEDFFNKCKNQYESDSHTYTPDYIGYQDGRVSIKIDEDALQYFPIREVWEVNSSKTLLKDYLISKNIQGTEEALFWRALQDSVNSDNLEVDFDFVINRLLNPRKKEEALPSEENILLEMKSILKKLSPIIGDLKYDHTELMAVSSFSNITIYVFHSKKYGDIRISKETNFFGDHGIHMDNRYPKTWKYIINHCDNLYHMDLFPYWKN